MATYWGRRNGRHGPCASTATTVPGRVPPAWRQRGRTSRRGTGAGAVEQALIQQVPVTLLLRLAPVLVRLRICVAGILVVGPATAGCLGLGSTRRGNRPIRGRRCTGCGNGRARFHRHGGLRRGRLGRMHIRWPRPWRRSLGESGRRRCEWHHGLRGWHVRGNGHLGVARRRLALGSGLAAGFLTSRARRCRWRCGDGRAGGRRRSSFCGAGSACLGR
jgi:hypothetical protein